MSSIPETRHDSHDARDELDLVGVLDILLAHRWSIAAITVLGLLLGTAYAFLAHPKYQADMMIQIEDSPDTSAAKSLLGDVSSLFDVKSSAAAEAQIVGSRLVVTRAVDRLRFYIDVKPKRFPVIGDFVSRLNSGVTAPGVFGLGGYAWGGEQAAIERFDVPKDAEGDTFELSVEPGGAWMLTGDDLARPVRGRVGELTAVPTRYGAAVLKVERFDAQPGTRFMLIRNSRAQTIDDVQTRLDVQEKIKQSGVVIATLAGDDPVRVSALLHEIGEQYVRQNIERKSADAAQSLAFLNDQLPVLKAQLDRSEARYTKLRNANGTVDLPEEARLALQQSAQAQTQRLLLQQKRDELATRFNSAHPSLVAIDRQIATLDAQAGGFDAQIKRLPDLQQEAARLMLDVRVNTDLYTALLNNTQQLQLVKAGKVGSVRVVDMPIVPQEPVKPNRPLVIAGAALGALVLGVVLAFARDLLFGGVNSPDEIERALGLDVYAAVPLSAEQRSIFRAAQAKLAGTHLLASAAPDDPTIESLRSLRTALRFSKLNGERTALVMTSAEPGAGKSFVLANLAAVLGAGGQRVIVVDADLRRGYLNQYFGVIREPGLSTVLQGRLDGDDVIHRGVVPNVDFIATGALLPHVGEWLLSERLGALIASLRERYDYVLIDAPPMLAATDAAILARHASAVLLVARAAQTRLGDLREALKRLAHGGLRPHGVVMNGLTPSLGRYGGRYGHYRYVEYRYAADAPAPGVLRRIARKLSGGGAR
ncbi:polysaccharide biosynthesis tyrosine autokinase [Burkholderia multivorans]|uniref:Putative tyrosine-protein kinase EpsB n=1 Tax=Burkholderia multivorans CGD2 TaxID=513052 RepID=B9BY83_9BURK|nr:polysaccharide biosynthesis tyrosine autokinase [Burkholderia multivorans]EEE04177.1 tyrosine-protein kinase wzc [Burkholderia multivorans CGD2]EEE14520.1 tyrosine-protein kinase wzc [Burkholderia multivorans CGD2M]